jgi:iron complex transport system ATP-binding protein
MEFLRVENLTAGYNHLPVLMSISFELEAGEFLAICGPNGSGKSTLLKAVQRLIPFVQGEIVIQGRSLFQLKTRDIASKIAYVPQVSEPIFDFSVEETVTMGRYLHQINRFQGPGARDRAVIEEVMHLTEISSFRKKKVSQLSGGERQRVLIARALAQDTPIIVLDEPSSHLDLNYQLQIYGLLKRLQQEKGKAIIVAEHNLNLVSPYCHCLMFLKQGRIESSGRPEEIINRDTIRKVFGIEVDIRENVFSGLPEISLIHQAGKVSDLK